MLTWKTGWKWKYEAKGGGGDFRSGIKIYTHDGDDRKRSNSWQYRFVVIHWRLANGLICVCRCTIDWQKGNNVTVKQIKKVQKHKGSGSRRTVNKNVKVDSFFNFFSPPTGQLLNIVRFLNIAFFVNIALFRTNKMLFKLHRVEPVHFSLWFFVTVTLNLFVWLIKI